MGFSVARSVSTLLRAVRPNVDKALTSGLFGLIAGEWSPF